MSLHDRKEAMSQIWGSVKPGGAQTIDVRLSDDRGASLRCFMSRFYGATGAGQEALFIDADETVRTALTVGWPLT